MFDEKVAEGVTPPSKNTFHTESWKKNVIGYVDGYRAIINQKWKRFKGWKVI